MEMNVEVDKSWSGIASLRDQVMGDHGSQTLVHPVRASCGGPAGDGSQTLCTRTGPPTGAGRGWGLGTFTTPMEMNVEVDMRWSGIASLRDQVKRAYPERVRVIPGTACIVCQALCAKPMRFFLFFYSTTAHRT